MKIVHYIPSIDRTAGGTSTYMQVLAKGLGEIAEVHIITHASENPLVMENCTVHMFIIINHCLILGIRRLLSCLMRLDLMLCM